VFKKTRRFKRLYPGFGLQKDNPENLIEGDFTNLENAFQNLMSDSDNEPQKGDAPQEAIVLETDSDE
jgi:hypothetical protein